MTVVMNEACKCGNVDHWSYSSAKLILDHGIDYAVAQRLGLLEISYAGAVDVGTLVHECLIGGEQDFVVSPYANFRKEEARKWRDAQVKPIINDEQFDVISKCVDQARHHPLYKDLLVNAKHEVKIDATINDLRWTGRIDAICVDDKNNVTGLVDIKTTFNYDGFKQQIPKLHYELQVGCYLLMLNKGLDIPFRWLVVETVAPFRVGVFQATPELVKVGVDEVGKCIAEYNAFKLRSGETDAERLSFLDNQTYDEIGLVYPPSWMINN